MIDERWQHLATLFSRAQYAAYVALCAAGEETSADGAHDAADALSIELWSAAESNRLVDTSANTLRIANSVLADAIQLPASDFRAAVLTACEALRDWAAYNAR